MSRAAAEPSTSKTVKEDMNANQLSSEEKEKYVSKEETVGYYTSTVGSYTAWKTDVNLQPPSEQAAASPADETTLAYYNALQYTLYETGYPLTVDRSNTPVDGVGKNRIAIAVLSSPVECMGICLEGGEQCPGDILLILNPKWLSKEDSERKDGTYSLFVLKAVTFEKTGRTFIDVFNPPRRVTYFINNFTHRCGSGRECKDGKEIELNLDCPMSSSFALSRLLDDKLWTRVLMSQADVRFPSTLAFTFCPFVSYKSENTNIRIVPLDTKSGVENVLIQEIKKFTGSPDMQKHEKIAVRPSGTKWHGCERVTVHLTSDGDSIVKATLKVLPELDEGNVIFLEAYHGSISQNNENVVKWGGNENNAIRVRVTVVRDLNQEPKMSKIICNVGLKRDAVTGENSLPQSLKTTLAAFGILDKVKQDNIHDEIKRVSENLLKHLLGYEDTMSLKERGGAGAQTDLIGIDYVLTETEGKIVPIGIGIHGHDCMMINHVSEFMYPQTKGKAFQTFLQTVVARSQHFLMLGKHVLVIGACGFGKQYIWSVAKEYGINVILVDNNAEHFASKLVGSFIHYEFTDHAQDEAHARNIIRLIAERKLTVNGCITFCDDRGPLVARINEMLDLGGSSLHGAMIAKKKSSTQQAITLKKGYMRHWPRTHVYSSKSFHISCAADIDDAAKKLEFPCVMKLEFGSSAVGVTLVQDVAQCHREWELVQAELQGEASHPCIGLGHGNTMLLMDYLGGTEHDVDIIIYKRQLIGAFASDNGPTRLPKFTETAAAMPTFLPDDKRRQLIIAAYQICIEVGLVSGVFNVEMKMTSTGPKLVEVNARMAGFYLRDWIKTLYSVDLLHCAFMIACDVKPIVPDNPPAGQLMGVMAIASVHRNALSDPVKIKLMEQLEDKKTIRVTRLEPELPPPGEDRYEGPYLNVAVLEADGNSARTKILDVLTQLGLNTDEYKVEEYLKDFKKHI